MRLPYIPDPPNFTNEDDKAVEQRVRKRRGEKGLIALDRTLLHAPPVADGCHQPPHFSARNSNLPRRRPKQSMTQTVLTHPPRTPPPTSVLGAKLSAVLAYTDAMTLDVTVPDEVFAALREHFSEKEVVEITATVAAYNCVSRFLVALDVGERNAQGGPVEGGRE
ncbi:hypothetical protein CFE70_002845 [Pyrenophora teres f. teres 0-1]